ncbi:MAG: NUDIX hydrolase [Actinomycetota bacterium]|nr:NUDIX hydrolase [Actinomycetota bacterium]
MAYTSEHPQFAVTVDIVVLTIREQRLCALLVRCGSAPFEGRWALPGGFVHVDENLRSAAVRELEEETAIAVESVYLEQLASYGEPDRDPRLRTVSVAWLAIAPNLPEPAAGTDAADAHWVPVEVLLNGEQPLAFDHEQILRDGVERAQAKLEYSTIGTAFCGEEFTIGDLRRVYEVVWSRRLDPGNFHRKVTGADGFVVETGEHVIRRGGRPAQLYRRGPAALLHPPLTRTSFHPSG